MGKNLEIRLSRVDLADALAWPARLVRGVPPNPVLGGVLLEAGAQDGLGDELTLTTFDYQVSATSTTTAAEVAVGGRALVSARLLAAVVKVLPAGPVELTADDEAARITAGTAEFVLPLLPVDDYPTPPSMPLPIGQVDNEVWTEAVQRVALVADMKATDALCGVLVTIDNGELRLAASDRYRLAEAVAPWQPALADSRSVRTLLVPATVLLEASKAIAGAGGAVTLAADDQAAGVFGLFCGGHQMTTPVLDLTFPKYRQLIPTEHTYRAVVSVDELFQAVERVSAIATDEVQAVTLTFDPGRVRLTAGLREYDGVGRDSVPAEVEGDGEFTIVFNAARLRAALSTIHAEYAEVVFVGASKIGVFRPLVDGEASSDFLHGVMPIRPPAAALTGQAA